MTVDASEHVTGRDFLLKIWNLLLSAPLGLRRAYLITGANEPRDRARALHAAAGTAGRARNSVESLFAAF